MPSPTPDPGRPTTRWLVLVRHAQAESLAETDHARALTVRGREDAGEAGRWLANLLERYAAVPEAAIVSDAVRARETWDALSDAAGWDLATNPDRSAYEADPTAALDLVRLVDPTIRSLVVVGHNPTIGVLAQLLQDGDGAPDAADAMLAGHPPAGVAVFEVEGEWSDLEEAGATLRGFHVGRA